MKVRKLRQEEHIRTRKLWETIFTEDTAEFLDYYYSVKTAENEIYVIEDAGEIVSMLHLNPYQMRVKEQIYQTHYIVAVATDERYRRRGLMAQLLNYALQVMAERGEPFTFLMPVTKTIYKPFGFEVVYEQNQCKVTGKCGVDDEWRFLLAEEADCKAIADFANDCLNGYDVVTWRTEGYYQTLLKEQESEGGGILLAMRNHSIEGVFCYIKEGGMEIREPLFYDKEILQQAVYFLTGSETEEVVCVGFGEETKPMVMAKVLNPEWTVDLQKAKVFLNEVV